MQIQVTYEANNIKLPDFGVWSNWNIFNCDLSLWYRVQPQLGKKFALAMEVIQPTGSKTLLSCALFDRNLTIQHVAADSSGATEDHLDWTLQALRAIIPGIRTQPMEHDYEKMVRELFDAKEEGDFEPSPWEDSFIDDMYTKVDELAEDEELHPTVPQCEKIEELHTEHCK